jgi:hypothetical protein
VIYLTGNKIAKLLRKAVKKVCPDTTPDKLKQYSAHSLQGWACVLLDEARKLPDYIKKRLRWLGDSFWMYLRDTAIHQTPACRRIASCLTESYGPNCCFAKGRYCPVHYDGGSGLSRHAQINRQNGLKDYKFTTNNYSHLMSLLIIPLKSYPLNLLTLHNRTQ